MNDIKEVIAAKIEDFEWNDIYNIVLIVAVCITISIFHKAIISDHSVRYYYLSGCTNNYQIRGDVNWGPDERIALERAITLEEAIKRVEDLNNTLEYNIHGE